MRRLLSLLVPLVALPSCATYHHGRLHHHHGANAADVAIAGLELIGAIAQLAATAQDSETVVHEEVVEAPPLPAEPAPPPPIRAAPPISTSTPVPPPPPTLTLISTPSQTLALPHASGASTADRPFDPVAARHALSAADLSACEARGVPRGWGHANVTYTPDGAAVRVAIDAPAGLSADAVRCVGDALGTPGVSSFAGGPVTVGTTWLAP